MSFAVRAASALTDPLTELPNARGFYMMLEQRIAECQRMANESLAVLSMDIDNFKQFSLYLIEHLGELLSTSQNLEEMRIVFQFVFSEIPTYSEIINRTPPMYPIFLINKPKKEPTVMVDSCINLNWQGG